MLSNILLLAFLPVFAVTASSNFCADKEDGLYQNPLACSSFYHCSNGYTYLKNCPGGLEFSVVGQICDWPSLANCVLPTTTTTSTTTTTTTTTEKPTPDPVPLYRYYDGKNIDHFYTTNWAELGNGNSNYKYEGVAGKIHASQVEGTVPLHRYYNGERVDHFYTTRWSELGEGGQGYRYEGVAGYVFKNEVQGTLPVYRYVTKNGVPKMDHFYTTNWNEIQDGSTHNYRFEFIQAYIFP